jgi:hypothetical protein
MTSIVRVIGVSGADVGGVTTDTVGGGLVVLGGKVASPQM